MDTSMIFSWDKANLSLFTPPDVSFQLSQVDYRAVEGTDDFMPVKRLVCFAHYERVLRSYVYNSEEYTKSTLMYLNQYIKSIEG